MLGPVVDIELVDPPDKTPPGVIFGVKHFLTIPNSPEVRESLEEGDQSHSHYFVKMTKTDGEHKMEIIDSTVGVTSQYFITDKLAGRSLCKITSAWFGFGSNPECTHSSTKNVYVTKSVGRCPHMKNSLFVWCVCSGSEKDFEKKMERVSHEPAHVCTEVNLEKSRERVYNIKVRISDRKEATWESARQISHIEMCFSNGVKRFNGTLKGSFGCGCGEGICGEGHDGLIFFDIEGHYPDDALLVCTGDKISGATRNDTALRVSLQHDTTTTPTTTLSQWGARSGTEEDKMDLKEVIIGELTKAANHGAIFIFCKQFVSMHTSGLDEELAEAVDGAFYESYRTWKHDNPTASTRQQVTKRDSITKILFCFKATNCI